MLRYAVIVLACLAVTTVTNAGCLTCMPINLEGDGVCESTTSGWCTYTCCLWDLGTRCPVYENVYRCVDPDGFGEMPATYFATKLPLFIEGSALRLRFAKSIPVPQKCAAVTLMLQGRSPEPQKVVAARRART